MTLDSTAALFAGLLFGFGAGYAVGFSRACKSVVRTANEMLDQLYSERRNVRIEPTSYVANLEPPYFKGKSFSVGPPRQWGTKQ